MKNVTVLDVRALSPLLFRDARPFGSGGDETRARGLIAPRPATTAGFVRTLTGDALGWNWQERGVPEQARALRVRGSVLQRVTGADGRAESVVPAPANAVVMQVQAGTDQSGGNTVMRLAPVEALKDGEGTDLPGGLRPLDVTMDGKPQAGYGWWRWTDVETWLTGGTPKSGGRSEDLPEKIDLPALDERVHVSLDADRKAAAESMLFTVEYRAMASGTVGKDFAEWNLRVLADLPELPGQARSHLGGERRPVAVTLRQGSETLLPLSDGLVGTLTGASRVCLMLVTPAAFRGGWQPGWAQRAVKDETAARVVKVADLPAHLAPLSALSGATLVGAAVGRPEAVSGWSLESGRIGPKRTQRLAPAGSVYFFELGAGQTLTAEQVRDLWCLPVSDDESNANDGAGVAVWGVWA